MWAWCVFQLSTWLETLFMSCLLAGLRLLLQAGCGARYCQLWPELWRHPVLTLYWHCTVLYCTVLYCTVLTLYYTKLRGLVGAFSVIAKYSRKNWTTRLGLLSSTRRVCVCRADSPRSHENTWLMRLGYNKPVREETIYNSTSTCRGWAVKWSGE